MSLFIAIAVGVLFVVGIAFGVYAIVAPRPKAVETAAYESLRERPTVATTGWTNEAGQEFADLSESARCDLVFAVAALDDERSEHLLEFALGDPTEAVALAAAHALAESGRTAILDRYLAAHPGERAERISATLSLLGSPERETVALAP